MNEKLLCYSLLRFWFEWKVLKIKSIKSEGERKEEKKKEKNIKRKVKLYGGFISWVVQFPWEFSVENPMASVALGENYSELCKEARK